jgi:hypothetical protein
MDEIINQETPILETPPIQEQQTTKKKPSIWIFLSILFFLTTVTLSYLLLNQKQEVNNEEVVKEEVETGVVEAPVLEENNSYNVTYKQDDISSSSKLILIDKNNNEIIVKEKEYWYLDTTNLIKPKFDNFIFSPDNNFFYFETHEYEKNIPNLYDIKNNKNISLLFTAYNDAGFSYDSKYFYACGEHGLNNGGAILLNLFDFKDIFSIPEGNFDCQYKNDINKIIFSEIDQSNINIIYQYEFSIEDNKFIKLKSDNI